MRSRARSAACSRSTATTRSFTRRCSRVALPFLVVGVVLTVRRLRDAGWPLWLVAVLLRAHADQPRLFHRAVSRAESVARGSWEAGRRDRRARGGELEVDGHSAPLFIREGDRGDPDPLAGRRGGGLLRHARPQDYGWSLFVGLPFVLPMLSVVIYGSGREVTLGQCLWIGLLWMLAAIVLLVATAFEGLICIIMMLPLAVPVVMLGAMVGYFIVELGPRPTRRSWQGRARPVRPPADDGGRRTSSRRPSPCSSPARPRW